MQRRKGEIIPSNTPLSPSHPLSLSFFLRAKVDPHARAGPGGEAGGGAHEASQGRQGRRRDRAPGLVALVQPSSAEVERLFSQLKLILEQISVSGL